MVDTEIEEGTLVVRRMAVVIDRMGVVLDIHLVAGSHKELDQVWHLVQVETGSHEHLAEKAAGHMQVCQGQLGDEETAH